MIEMCDEIDPAWVGPRRGDGVFTTIRVKDGAAFDWSAHIARLRRHGEAYGLGPLPSEEAVAAASGRRLADAALSEGEAILRLALWRTHAGRD